MPPQNSDPNNHPSGSLVQPDLSSVLGSGTPTVPSTPPPEPGGFGSLPVDPPGSEPLIDPVMQTPSLPFPPPAPIPEPTPTPQPAPEPIPQSTPPTSAEPIPTPSLDNPMGVPPGEPQIDGGLNSGFNWSNPPPPQPATSEPYPQPPLSPEPTMSPFDQPPPPITSDTPTQSAESAPTDLSQLTNVYTPPPMSTPETLVVPPITPEATTLQAESSGGHGIPKWIWMVGAVILLLVAAASAYFILGIGQTPKPTSAPAVVEPQTLVAPPIPNPSPVTQAPSTATSSAGFGGISGGTGTQTASSAADILKAKLQAK